MREGFGLTRTRGFFLGRFGSFIKNGFSKRISFCFIRFSRSTRAMCRSQRVQLETMFLLEFMALVASEGEWKVEGRVAGVYMGKASR